MVPPVALGSLVAATLSLILSESAHFKDSCSAALKTRVSSTKSSRGPALEVAEANVHFVGPSRICRECCPLTARQTSCNSLPGDVIWQCTRREIVLPAACNYKIGNAWPRD